MPTSEYTADLMLLVAALLVASKTPTPPAALDPVATALPTYTPAPTMPTFTPPPTFTPTSLPPSPTSTPPSPTPVQAAPPRRAAPKRAPLEYGIQAHGEHKLPEVVHAVQDLGMTWVKQQVRWEQIEGAQSVYGWAGLDHIVDAYNRAGFKVLLSVTAAPDWTRPDGTARWPSTASYARMARQGRSTWRCATC